jgi:hypothetical protein
VSIQVVLNDESYLAGLFDSCGTVEVIEFGLDCIPRPVLLFQGPQDDTLLWLRNMLCDNQDDRPHLQMLTIYKQDFVKMILTSLITHSKRRPGLCRAALDLIRVIESGDRQLAQILTEKINQATKNDFKILYPGRMDHV